YADGGDRVLDEDAPLHPTPLLEPTLAAHRNVAEFAESGRTGVRLRIAALHGDDDLTRLVLRGARFGMPVAFGDPAGWFTAIHPADAAAGAVAALGAPSGVYNVGANPIRKRDYANVLAAAAGRRKGRVVPKALLAGPMAMFGASWRVSSARLSEAT